MKAIRVHEFGGPEVMKLEDLPRPHAGRGQVVVKIAAVGVNPTDTYSRSGASRRPSLPYTPGIDAAGTVESTGEDIARFRTGDRVYVSGSISGTYAEEALCLEHQVHPLPDRLSFAQGAAIGIPYSTAYRALFQLAKAAPGEIVLVHGATGGVGLAATQLAVAAGLEVIGTGGTKEGRRLVSEQGAQHVLDHGASGYLDEVHGLTQGHGVDVIVEMLANVNLEGDLRALALKGRVVVVGSRGRVEIDPRDAMQHDASIIGMLIFNASPGELSSIFGALGKGLEHGRLRPVVRQEIPLAEAPRAHLKVMEGGSLGKIVLVP